MGSDNLVPISQVADIVLGGTPKRSEDAYWGGDIKWASAKDITSVKTRYIYNTEETITALGLEESNTKLLPKDTIVITARGTVGAMAMLSEPMTFNQTCYGLLAKEGVDSTHLFYALKAGLSKIKSVSYGTVFDTITMKSFDAITIPLPPLEEQKRIAHILGTLDDKIELNQRMNETLEDIARAVFKSWFVDFDPVRAKMAGEPYPLPDEVMALFPDELVDGELGLIPKGWEGKSLSEIADFMNGAACQKYPAKPDEPSLPVLKIRELRKGNFDAQSDRASLDIPGKYIVKNGDVIFSWSGSLFVEIWTGGEGFLNQHLFKVTSEAYPKWFYFYWIKHHLSEFQSIAAGKATTMGHIKRNHLEEAKVVIPQANIFKYSNRFFSSLLLKQQTNSVMNKINHSILSKLINELILFI